MSERVMKYSISKCPVCEDGNVKEFNGSVICSHCGNLNKQVFLEKLLNITPTYANKIFNDGNYGTPPVESELKAVRIINGEQVVINAYHESSPVYSHPTLWPKLMDKQDIILIDDATQLCNFPPNTMAYTGDWISRWNGNWCGKQIKLMYSGREAYSRSIAHGLLAANVKVLFGRYEKGKVYENFDHLVGLTENGKMNVTKEQEGHKLGELNLKDVVARYHQAVSHGRPIYLSSLNRPVYEVAEDVMTWFLQNGARRVWNVEDKVGHLIFKDQLFNLRTSDPYFKSLLWKEGGISNSTPEGRAIIDCLCSMALDSEKVFPESFLKADVDNYTIEIKQGTESIIINNDGVKKIPNDKLTFDLLRGDEKWFQPIQIVDGDGLMMLKTAFIDYFAIPTVAKEIILTWLLGIFLQDFSSIRPGIHVTGPASTGKSTILLLCYWLFYGKNSMSLPGGMTKAGLWRLATVEPFILIDNKNLTGMSESLQEFLDMCATGGERGLGVANGSARDMMHQQAHSIVMLSGLDHCIHQDVRTRYFEIQTDFRHKTGFYAINNKKMILNNRNLIMSSVFRMFSKDVLPNLHTYANEEMARKYRLLLTDKKERTVDYFLLMLAIGEALQKHGVIAEGDLGLRWSEYLRNEARLADKMNAISIEWWKNFKIALLMKADEFSLFRDGKMVSTLPYKFIEENGKRFGITGSKEEILNAMAWTANVLKRKLPWNNIRELSHDHISDLSAWNDAGWSYKFDEEIMEVRWGDGV